MKYFFKFLERRERAFDGQIITPWDGLGNFLPEELMLLRIKNKTKKKSSPETRCRAVPTFFKKEINQSFHRESQTNIVLYLCVFPMLLTCSILKRIAVLVLSILFIRSAEIEGQYARSVGWENIAENLET